MNKNLEYIECVQFHVIKLCVYNIYIYIFLFFFNVCVFKDILYRYIIIYINLLKN